MEPVCAFSVPPEQDPRLLGEVQAGPGLVQSVAHKYKYKYKLALPWCRVLHKHKHKYKLTLLWCRVLHAPMRVVFSVLAEELGHRLSTFRGTESNLYCTYCRFYNALPPFLASRCFLLECSSLKLTSLFNTAHHINRMFNG